MGVPRHLYIHSQSIRNKQNTSKYTPIFRRHTRVGSTAHDMAMFLDMTMFLGFLRRERVHVYVVPQAKNKIHFI